LDPLATGQQAPGELILGGCAQAARVTPRNDGDITLASALQEQSRVPGPRSGSLLRIRLPFSRPQQAQE
jgi:hypothetical protein